MSRLAALGLCLAAVVCPPSAGRAHGPAHDAAEQERLPTIGPAPDFSLTSQDGRQVALHDLRGKAVAVAFIYTSCTDVCAMLTEKMAQVRDELGPDFGQTFAFASITVDPERDTREVLKGLHLPQGVRRRSRRVALPATGELAAVREVARRYGVAVSGCAGAVDHALLTSLVDGRGMLRVQYLGHRFDADEFRRDLVGLASEP